MHSIEMSGQKLPSSLVDRERTAVVACARGVRSLGEKLLSVHPFLDAS
jgi:hypothetical protein